MLEIKNVSRSFGNETVLANINMTINGGMNFIIGPSGSGKTTLLKILSAMDSEYTGVVFYNGVNLKNISANEKCAYYNSTFGFISQSFNLIDGLTVYENMCLPQYLKDGENRAQILSLLKTMQISQFANTKINKLSGGQRQRVAIARELLKNPDILIADELTAALDPKTAQEIIALLHNIAKSRTVIVVTHDTELIESTAAVFELDKGELTAVRESTARGKAKKQNPVAPKLKPKSAFRASSVSLRRFAGRSIALLLAVIVCAGSLCINFSGSIGQSVSGSFSELQEKYGNTLLET